MFARCLINTTCHTEKDIANPAFRWEWKRKADNRFTLC